MAYTITIVNKNVNPTVVGEGYLPLVVISPTGITTPQTPYADWVADASTLLNGSVSVPAWKKLQYFTLPASSKLVLITDIADEAVYYQELSGKITGVDITVEDAPLTVYSLALTYGKVVAGGSAVTPTVTATGFTLANAAYTVDGDAATINASTGALTGVTAGETVTVTVTGDTGESDGSIPVTATAKVTIAEE